MSSRRVSRASSSTNTTAQLVRTTSASRRSRRGEQQQQEEEEEEQEQQQDDATMEEREEQQQVDEEEEEEKEVEAEGEEEQKEGESASAGEDVPASASASASGASFVATPAASSRRKSRAASADYTSPYAAPSSLDNSMSMEDTPTRLSRLDEKSELQGLNKRLEFYILNRRERDASADGWVRELEGLKNKHAADLEHQKKLFENQLGLVRKNRDELSANLSKFEGENAHQSNALKELQARLALEHKARGALEGRVDSLQQELLAAQNALHGASLARSNLQHEYAALKSSHDDLEASLDTSRRTQEAAQSKANKLAQQYGDLSDEYDTLQTRNSADVKKYESEIHTLCQENHRSVDGIRADCEARLNVIFAERQQQYEDDKAEALATLKHHFDEKLLGYRTRLEELGHDLEQEKSNHKAAARALDKENRNVITLLAELKQSQAALAAAEQALNAERANPELSRALAEKQETIRRLKVSFKRKDLEFDELMDVKIMLDLEIKAYRTLLDQEDIRVGNIKDQRAHMAQQVEKQNQERYERQQQAQAQQLAQQQQQAAATTTSSKSSKKSKSSRKSRAVTVTEESNEESTTEEGAQQMQVDGEDQPASAESTAQDGEEGGLKAEESEEPTETEEESGSRKRRRTSSRRQSSRSRDPRGSAITNESNGDESEAASAAATSQPAKTGATLFSRVDASGEYVAMQNNTGKAAPISGWSLRAPRHGVVYPFPDVQLAAGATFFVTSAEDVLRARPMVGDQVGRWPRVVEWDQDGDVVELVSAAGTVVVSVAVLPRLGAGGGKSLMELEGEETQPEVVAGGAAAAAAGAQADNDKANCIVM